MSPRTALRPGAPVIVVGAALVSLATALSAQDRSRTPEAVERFGTAERGWIGVSFDISGDGSGRVAILITEVSDDSPASEAGLRPGDRVLAVNELRTARELAALPELLRLRAGDPVVMVVERDGDRRRYRMRAAPRPGDFTAGRRVEVYMRSDSLVDIWSRSMDSLRIHLGTEEGIAAARIRGAISSRTSPRVRVAGGDSENRARPPFEFFIFRGETHDSLRQEMVEVNALVGDLEARIRSREQELRRRLGSLRSAGLRDDAELRRLHAQLDRASARSAELESAMVEAARTTAGFEYDPEAEAEHVVIRSRASRAEASGEFRPLTPYLLGRNRVAGAEVIDLEPELARYFDVSGGVLVTRVAPGTPAAIAGLLPGDVITRIDQVVVRAVEDLRHGVSVAGEMLPVTLIREGESRQVLLRKR